MSVEHLFRFALLLFAVLFHWAIFEFGQPHSPRSSYAFIASLTATVYLAYRPANVFYPPLLLYLSITAVNIFTVVLLDLSEGDVIDFFGYELFPEERHFRILTKGQLIFASGTLLALIMFSPFRSFELTVNHHYDLIKRFWLPIYTVGVCAIAYLLIKSGGLDAAATSRKERAAGSGGAIILQYMVLVGIAFFILSKPNRGILFHLAAVAVLGIPLVLTHERSFILAMTIGTLAFHALYKGTLRTRHLVMITPVLVIAMTLMLAWRFQLMGTAGDLDASDWLWLLAKDLSMNTGYLVYRETNLAEQPGELRAILLTFSFFSKGIGLVLGEIPISPNNAFSNEVFPHVYGTTTFSMGPFGEARYILGGWSFCYGFMLFGLIHLLSDVVAKRDPVFMILLSGLVFRLAKGGLTGGMQAIWIVLLLLLSLRAANFALSIFADRQRRSELP